MLTNLDNISDFSSFIMEKSGVIERNIYSEIDETDISRIINRFMRHIIIKPDDVYETYEMMFNEMIRIRYIPTDGCEANGAAGKNEILIYRRVDSRNYLEVKYTLAHEMVHIMRQILTTNEHPYEDLSISGKLRYNLVKISGENMKNYRNSRTLMFLLYMIDTNEVFSRNQNAYIKAYRHKLNNPDKSDYSIVTDVLKEMGMTEFFFNSSVLELKKTESFTCVISFLIGNFFELGKSGFQSYFDKTIFRIPVVKEMRKEMRTIITNAYDLDLLIENTLEMIRKHMSELCTYKDKITDSFITHMSYWFNEARKRLCKAIGLGIDDATDQNPYFG